MMLPLLAKNAKHNVGVRAKFPPHANKFCMYITFTITQNIIKNNEYMN